MKNLLHISAGNTSPLPLSSRRGEKQLIELFLMTIGIDKYA
jgi:hypothetical protein